MEILKQYKENGMDVTEYTKDGVTCFHKLEVASNEETDEPYVELPPVETVEEKINRLESQIQEGNIVMFEALAVIYEEMIRQTEGGKSNG